MHYMALTDSNQSESVEGQCQIYIERIVKYRAPCHNTDYSACYGSIELISPTQATAMSNILPLALIAVSMLWSFRWKKLDDGGGLKASTIGHRSTR